MKAIERSRKRVIETSSLAPALCIDTIRAAELTTSTCIACASRPQRAGTPRASG